jgi:hypothetical protein
MSDNIAPSSSTVTSPPPAFNFLLDLVKAFALGAAAEIDSDIKGGLGNLEHTHKGALNGHFPPCFNNDKLMLDIVQSLVDHQASSTSDGIQSVLAAKRGSKYLFVLLPTHDLLLD